MKTRLLSLDVSCKNSVENIVFTDFNYFYGQMGAGKSTIARLIDYCLGGDLEMTPALQSEFVSAGLTLQIDGHPLVLVRDAHSGQIRTQWAWENQQCDALVPARTPHGEVIPGSGIEVISDLFFYLAGKNPPRVRRSKAKEDSELERLSLRDLLWYCYLDQDSMDSSFFHLDSDANTFKRLKSLDVLRFLIGFHQEQVAELEMRLELKKQEHMRAEAGVAAIRNALSSAELASELEISEARNRIEKSLRDAENLILSHRDRSKSLRTHAIESLQTEGRKLSATISQLESAISEIKESIEKDKTHRNELLSIAIRHRRSQSARDILNGVDFTDCPRCGRSLPSRSPEVCPLCDQGRTEKPSSVLDDEVARQDLDARVTELAELLSLQEEQLSKQQRQLREAKERKGGVDANLIEACREYDSAYLAEALGAERRRSALQQELLDLQKLEVLVQRIESLSKQAFLLAGEEQTIRAELKDARARAEKDTANLSRLRKLFLDCLLRARIPGFYEDDVVGMGPPNFLPEVTSNSGDLAVTSFATLGSGGKKTLFKCCFAVAIHRLASEIGAMLPTLLVIDSPMKNISERENIEQFEGFHQMLYELSESELSQTQFILIDKELQSPPATYGRLFTSRHMKPDDNANPPLIHYYRGK
jgi:rubrerythrin